MVPDEVRSRYPMIIDGEVMDSKRVKHLTKDSILAKHYLSEIEGLKNWIESYKAQITNSTFEFERTQYRLDRARYGENLTSAVASLEDVPARQLATELKYGVQRKFKRWLRSPAAGPK